MADLGLTPDNPELKKRSLWPKFREFFHKAEANGAGTGRGHSLAHRQNAKHQPGHRRHCGIVLRRRVVPARLRGQGAADDPHQPGLGLDAHQLGL